jgi:hypothetical protein
MKPSKKTSVPEKPKYIEIKHYILRDEVQKGEAILQYISTDEQIIRYFGKASIQDERDCILKKQAGPHGNDFLNEKGRYDSQVGRENYYVIDLWTVIFQFEKWSRMSSSFPFQKVV